MAMRARFLDVLQRNDLPLHKGTRGATLATLRHLVIDRVSDPEKSFRTALLDLRHGIEVVKLMREVSRRVELFGLIRWCDDWLGARRTLVARVEAQLPWFTDQGIVGDTGRPSAALPPPPTSSGEVVVDDRKPRPTRNWHTDRNT